MGTPPFALFDPRSAVSRLRRSVRPDDKLRGYFHWLTAQQEEAGRAAVGLRAAAADAGARLVVRADRPDEALPAEVWVKVLPFGAEPVLKLTFQLGRESDCPPGPVPCLAFLIEPAVLDRLAAGRPGLGSAEPAATLAQALRDLDAGDLDAVRLFSALPELEGEVDEYGFGRCAECRLPADSAALPERVTVAIVVAGWPT
jgi:hypothetical protein